MSHLERAQALRELRERAVAGGRWDAAVWATYSAVVEAQRPSGFEAAQHAKDIPDEVVVQVVSILDPRYGAMLWDIENSFAVPRKLMLAKLRKLVLKQALEGCYCGCSGSFMVRGIQTGLVLSHPNGSTYVVGSSAPDDAERMTCPVSSDAHRMCGVWACCGWPRFLVCPCQTGLQT